MSATPPQTPAVRAREIRVVQDDSPIAYLVDTARFEQTQRIATLMSHASLMPKHLGNGQEQRMANAFLIVGQSLRWGLDPFAVAPETYEVGGKLGFQGKLVAAVINARAGLSCPLEYHYNGKQGDEMACVVVGYEQKVEWTDDLETLLDAVADSDDAKAERRLARMGIKTVRITVAQAKTENKMWRTDPKQKLCYSGAVKWARRHRPEIILGVLTDEDMEAMEARLASAKTVVSVVPPRVATSFARSSAADLQQTALPEPAPKGAEEASAATPPAETPLPEATATAEPTEPKPAPGPERRTTSEEGVR